MGFAFAGIVSSTLDVSANTENSWDIAVQSLMLFELVSFSLSIASYFKKIVENIFE